MEPQVNAQPVTEVVVTQPVQLVAQNNPNETNTINSFIEQKAIENKAREMAGETVHTNPIQQQQFGAPQQDQWFMKHQLGNQEQVQSGQLPFWQQLQQQYQSPQQLDPTKQVQQEQQLAFTPEQVAMAIEYADVINEVIDSISTMTPDQINQQANNVNNIFDKNTKEIERVNEQLKNTSASDAEKMQNLQNLAKLETENQFMKDQMSYFKEIAWKQSLELQELKNNYENFQLNEKEKNFLYAQRAIEKDANNLFAKMELSKMAQKILEDVYGESLQPAINLMQQRQAFAVNPSTGINLPQNAMNPQVDTKAEEIRKAMQTSSFR
jgi:hypothetical protein